MEEFVSPSLDSDFEIRMREVKIISVTQFSASLWGDESWAVTLAVKPVWKIITIVAKDTSPPFYYLCQHLWMKIFGTSEVSIRSLSFLFFIITVLTVYLIGNYLWDKKTGFWAAALTFFNPFLFIYAFEGRMYAALLATSTLSVYFFLKKYRLGFVLATAAALYSHHFSIFVVFWEALWQVKRSWGKPFKEFLFSFKDFFLVGLLYAPWFYPLYYQTSMVAGGFWLGKPTLKTLGEAIIKFIIGSGKETTRQLAGGAIIITLLLRQWLKDRQKTAFLLGWFFAPLLATFLLSQVMQSIFYDRYMLVAIPGATLLIASLQRKFSFVPILVAIGLLASLNYHYFTHPTKRPFRDFAQMIKAEAPGLTLINYNAAAHHLWESKYYGLNAPIYSPEDLPFYVGTALMEEGDVIKELPDVDELGVITSANPEEVEIPGYSTQETKQLDSLFFLKMEKIENKLSKKTAILKDWKVYESKQWGFQINYPTSWLIDEQSETKGLIYLLTPQRKQDLEEKKLVRLFDVRVTVYSSSLELPNNQKRKISLLVSGLNERPQSISVMRAEKEPPSIMFLPTTSRVTATLQTQANHG